MGLGLFLKNIRYLFKHNVKRIHMDVEHLQQIGSRQERCVIPLLQYTEWAYRSEPTGVLKKPVVMSAENTLTELLTTEKSLVRYGEGELYPIKGGRAVFQEANTHLGKRLAEILHSDDDNILLCVQTRLWYMPESHIRYRDWYDNWFVNRPYLRLIAEEYMRDGKVYGETAATHLFNEEAGLDDFDAWYARWRLLWEGKHIAVICGDRVFKKLEYNVFDNAASIEYMHVPTCDAFAQYDDILEQATKLSKEKLICIIAGPTATVLAYDMAKLGYRALDLGHLPKGYDIIKRQLPSDHELRRTFWEAD